MAVYTRNGKGEVIGSVLSLVVTGESGETSIVNAVTNYDDQGRPTAQNINGHDSHGNGFSRTTYGGKLIPDH